jgi:hypothetical protein
MSKLQEKPSDLKREHRELKKIKFINFSLRLWVIFALLDPVSDCESGWLFGTKAPSVYRRYRYFHVSSFEHKILSNAHLSTM